MGPTFRKNVSVGANAVVKPLQAEGWLYRVLPFNAAVMLSARQASGNLGDVQLTFSSGSDVQAQDQPIPLGTAFEENVNMMDQYLGAAGDELGISLRNTTAGAIVVLLTVRLQPI